MKTSDEIRAYLLAAQRETGSDPLFNSVDRWLNLAVAESSPKLQEKYLRLAETRETYDNWLVPPHVRNGK